MTNGPSKAVRIIAGIIAVLLILIIGIVLTLHFMDWNRFRGFIADRSQQMTGRPLVIHGDLDVKLGLSPVISAGRVTYGNAPWGLAPQMFRAESMLFKVRLLPLLAGRLEVPRLVLNDASILLERNEAGIGNWQLDPEAPPEPEPDEMTIPLLGEARIRNVRFGFIDHGETQQIGGNLDYFLLTSTAEDTLDAPMEMRGQGALAGLPFGVQGRLGSLLTLAERPAPFPFHIEGRFADVTVEAEGRIQEPLRFQGTELDFSTRVENIQEILRAFEMQPEGIRTEFIPPMRASGRVIQNGHRWTVTDLDAAFGYSLFLGEVSFEPREERPYLSVNIRSPRVNVNELARLMPETPPRPPDEPLFTEEPLPLDMLKAYDADIDLHIQRIVGAGLAGGLVNEARIQAALHNGRLVVRPLYADIVDGEIRAGTVVDVRDIPRLNVGLSIQRLALSKVIEEVDPAAHVEGWIAEEVMDLTEQIAGHLGGRVILQAQGRSAREIAKSLNGEIDFAMEHGQFSYVLKRLMALDLGRGLLQWLAGDEPVVIDCFLATFDVNKGMLNTETMLLATEAVNAWGEGWIDIPQERLSFTLHALPRSPGLVSLRTPLIIEGEFREPSVYPEPVPLIGRVLTGLVDRGPGQERVCAEYLHQIREIKE